MDRDLPLPVIEKIPMDGRPVLDEESFTRLLAAAYVMQEHQDRIREKLPPPDFTQIVAQVVETQHLIQTRSLEVKAALMLIAERLQKLSGAAGVAIGVLSQNELHYQAAVGSASGLLGSRMPWNESISSPCLQSRENLRVVMAEQDPRIDRAWCRRLGAQSLLAVPFYHERKIAGALEVYRAQAGAFQDSDVRAGELMAGLVTEVMAQAAEQELKQELAAERASVLLALEKLKPQLQRLAGEEPAQPAATAENMPVSANTSVQAAAAPAKESSSQLCRACGHAFASNEASCTVCGASRSSGQYPGSELQSKWATLWERQQAESAEGTESVPALRKPLFPEEPVPVELSKPFDFSPAVRPATEATANLPMAVEEEGPAAHTDALTTEPAKAEQAQESPWKSASGARDWLRAQMEKESWRKHLKSIHAGDVSLGLSALVLIIVLVWGLWPQKKNDPAPAAQAVAQGAAVKRKPRPKPPELSLFEKALVSLGLAEPPPAPQYMGNPNVKVWVDLQTALYYCPGAELYGTTPKGKYTTQEDAQQDQFEPAYRKPCD